VIQRELESISESRTTLVIAHRLSTVVHADQILVMDHGRIVERGTHAELLARGGAYASMWEIQSREQAKGEPTLEAA
jgi:ABC-type transport system involved in Fe-S cluster assembly fused permease/ATPase subunit